MDTRGITIIPQILLFGHVEMSKSFVGRTFFTTENTAFTEKIKRKKLCVFAGRVRELCGEAVLPEN